MRRNKSDEESCGQASCMRVRNNNNDGPIIRFHTKYQSLEEVMKFKSHFHFLIRLYLNLIRYDFVFFLSFPHFNSHHNVVARANPKHPCTFYICVPPVTYISSHFSHRDGDSSLSNYHLFFSTCSTRFTIV